MGAGDFGEGCPLLAGETFHGAKARGEFGVGFPKSDFRVELEEAREINRDEKEIAEFGFDGRDGRRRGGRTGQEGLLVPEKQPGRRKRASRASPGRTICGCGGRLGESRPFLRQRKLKFAGFFGEFHENAVNVVPVEADAGGLAGQLQGFEEGGEGAGNAVEDGFRSRGGGNGGRERFGFAFLKFDLFPVAEDVSGSLGPGGTEDVRMAADHFFVDFTNDVGNVEAVLFVGDLGVK